MGIRSLVVAITQMCLLVAMQDGRGKGSKRFDEIGCVKTKKASISSPVITFCLIKAKSKV